MMKSLLPGTVIYSFLEARIPHPATTLEKLTNLIEIEEKELIQSTINKQRNKLGVNLGTVAAKIRQEVYENSKVRYKAIID